MNFVPYPPENTTEAIAVFKQDVGIVHEVANGDENTEVLTENGLIPSAAKAISMLSGLIKLKPTSSSISVSRLNSYDHYLFTNDSDVTLTLQQSTLDLNKTCIIFVTQLGLGFVNIAGASGVTVKYPSEFLAATAGVNTTVALMLIADNTWLLVGNLRS